MSDIIFHACFALCHSKPSHAVCKQNRRCLKLVTGLENETIVKVATGTHSPRVIFPDSAIKVSELNRSGSD